jgi:cyclopropane fatty-acyl-phospholipid synthase-like methyltransferase
MMKIDKDFYKKHPKTCDPEDFWGQVKRTVNGTPVSQDQIDMIVTAVRDGLELNPDDRLLDLCCGNGALTDYFFNICRGGLGVDSSEYLINVALKNFSSSQGRQFLLDDVVQFVKSSTNYGLFNKALCYASMQYLPKTSVYELFEALRSGFPDIKRFFVGNIPDKKVMHEFFGDNYEKGIENEHGSPIGIWWLEEEIRELADNTGWLVKISKMPGDYYYSYYRFDAVFTPEQ